MPPVLFDSGTTYWVSAINDPFETQWGWAASTGGVGAGPIPGFAFTADPPGSGWRMNPAGDPVYSLAFQFYGPEPAAQIEAIVEAVDLLESAGFINNGQATSLRATLGNALAHVAGDQIMPAINLLGAFTHQVLAQVANGSLTLAQGQELVVAAQSVMADLLAELEDVTP